MTADDMVQSVTRDEWVGDARTSGGDHLAREEPLEIRIRDVPIVVVMRTPGHDEDLVRGFLLTEGIAGPAQVRRITECDVVDPPEAEGNVMQVTLSEQTAFDIARLRRNLYAASSCGVCGKASIEAILDRAPPLSSVPSVSARTLATLPRTLRTAQPTFDTTGGLHAAGLFDLEGTLLAAREDVGRHNAVDKVVGWASTRDRLPATGLLLAVSGRISFEVVQKAHAAGIGHLVGVSAPTSLAVALAERSGMTVTGFARGERLCVYSNRGQVMAA